MYRQRKAREHFIERVRQTYEKVYDEETNTYFYFNKLKGTSQWTTPKVLLGRPLEPRVRARHLRKYVVEFDGAPGEMHSAD